MNLVRATERAVTVCGPKTAARLYNDIEYELALGEPDDRLENIGQQALERLESRFPGVQQAARQIEEPPSLSRRAGDALHGIARTPQQAPVLLLPVRPQWPSRRFRGHALTHLVGVIAMTAVVVVVLVKIWPFVVLGLIALATSQNGRLARGRRRRR